VTSAEAFADDFIRALGEGVAGAWRERWWTLDLVLVHGLQMLSEMERAQEEFFHLFEALKRRGARILLVADRPPTSISGIDDRLRSRFESGLVLEVDSGTPGSDLVMEDRTLTFDDSSFLAGLDLGDRSAEGASAGSAAVGVRDPTDGAGPARQAALPTATSTSASAARSPAESSRASGTVRAEGAEPAGATHDGAWHPSPENVVVVWPRMGDLLIEELD